MPDALYLPRLRDRVHVRLVANPAALPERDGKPDHRPFYVSGTIRAIGISGADRVVTCDEGTERRVHVEDLSPETPGTSTSGRRAA